MNLETIENPCKYLKKLLRNSGLHVHHITPRCLGGTDDWDNLSILTMEQHRDLHIQLATEHPKLMIASVLMQGLEESAYTILKSEAGKLGALAQPVEVKRRNGRLAVSSGQLVKTASKGGKSGGSVVGRLKYFNNGIINKRAKSCPEGFIPGQIKKLGWKRKTKKELLPCN